MVGSVGLDTHLMDTFKKRRVPTRATTRAVRGRCPLSPRLVPLPRRSMLSLADATLDACPCGAVILTRGARVPGLTRDAVAVLAERKGLSALSHASAASVWCGSCEATLRRACRGDPSTGKRWHPRPINPTTPLSTRRASTPSSASTTEEGTPPAPAFSAHILAREASHLRGLLRTEDKEQDALSGARPFCLSSYAAIAVRMRGQVPSKISPSSPRRAHQPSLASSITYLCRTGPRRPHPNPV